MRSSLIFRDDELIFSMETMECEYPVSDVVEKWSNVPRRVTEGGEIGFKAIWVVSSLYVYPDTIVLLSLDVAEPDGDPVSCRLPARVSSGSIANASGRDLPVWAPVVVGPPVLNDSGVVPPDLDVGESNAIVLAAAEASVRGGNVDFVSEWGHYEAGKDR